MKKIVNFIKYNNAFTIIVALVMFSTAGAFANEKSREAIVGKTVVTRIGMDNIRIISADLDSFDIGLKIKSVKEDDKFYYVNFDYNAIDAKDGVWQTVKKEKNINVSKVRLGDTDLGLYLAEELKQLTEREMSYMKEVQSIEKSKGAQKQVESVEYTGLKGLVFDDETKEIAGYNPVKEKENQKAEVVGVFNPSPKNEEEKKTEKGEDEKVVRQVTVVKEMVSKETIMQMVKEALAQEQASEVSASSASSLPALPTGQAGGEAGSSQSSSETSAGQASSEQASSVSSEAASSSSSSESSSSSSEQSASSESSSLPSSETSAGQASSESSSSSSAEASASLLAEESGSSSLPAGEASSSISESSVSSESSEASSEASSSSSAESSSGESSSGVAI